MKRFTLPAVTVAAVALLLLTGCAGNMRDDDPSLGNPPMFGEPGEGESAAIGLVNLWKVTDAEGEAAETWLRLDAGEFQLWRDCGMIMGSWRATDTLFLVEANSASGDCVTDGNIPDVPWLHEVTGFAATADGYDLRGGAGVTVASLTIDGAPEPNPNAAEFYTQPPEITEDVRIRFLAAAPLPGDLQQPEADALHGKWVPVGTNVATDPHVVFNPDGTWTGSDGCNGGSGRWALGDDGEFLATSGPSTLMFCEGASVPSWVALAASAGLSSDGALHLFDTAGVELGILSR